MENKQTQNTDEEIDDIYDMLLDLLKFIPGPLKSKIEKELQMIKELIFESRAPRFVFIGRRGAGKSSLINAIFGEHVAKIGSVKSQTGKSKWHTYSNSKGSMEILDTRGLGEGSKPDEEHSEENEIKEIKSSIAEQCPDVIIFLCKAKETDSRINEDLENLKELTKFIFETHKYEIPILTVATQADEVDPASDRIPPFRKPEKFANIEASTDNLYKKVLAEFPQSTFKIAVSSYLEFNENNKIEIDWRWNIDKLIELLLEHIPNSAHLMLAKISRIKSSQKKVARTIIAAAASICAAIASEPIPLADLPFITGVQIAMIIGIGYVGGHELNKKAAMEFMSAMGLNIGAAFGLRELARGLVKLIPGAGSVISAGIASAGTFAIGEAAISYFIDKKSKVETKNKFDETILKEKNKENR